MRANQEPLTSALLALTPKALWSAEQGVTLHDFWQGLTNVTTSGPNHRTLTKDAGGAAWNASGASCASLPGDGYVEFGTNENTTAKIAGLSTTNPDTSFASISFGVYPDNGGNLNVEESGATIGPFGVYAAGDRFRVQRVGVTITYWRKPLGGAWALFYTSLVASTGTLIFDSSMFTVGATLTEVELFGAVTNTGPWQNIVNASVAGSTATNTAGSGGGFDAGTSSSYAIAGDGFVEFTTQENTTHKMAGLAAVDPGATYASIDFALYLAGDGTVLIYELGGAIGAFGPGYAAGDEFRVQCVGAVVTYWQKHLGGAWTLLYTSLVARPVAPLMFDTSFFNIGGTITILRWSGESKRCRVLRDLSGSGYDLAQLATPELMPLWIAAGEHGRPCLHFDKLRGDTLTCATPLALGVNPYSIASAHRWRAAPGAEVNSTLIQCGNFAVDGFMHCYNNGAGAELHYLGYGAVGQSICAKAANFVLGYTIVRNAGATLDWRLSGVNPAAPIAFNAQAAPTTAIQVGAYSGMYKADLNLCTLAVFARSISDADAGTVDDLFEAHYGINIPDALGAEWWIDLAKRHYTTTGPLIDTITDESGHGHTASAAGAFRAALAANGPGGGGPSATFSKANATGYAIAGDVGASTSHTLVVGFKPSVVPPDGDYMAWDHPHVPAEQFVVGGISHTYGGWRDGVSSYVETVEVLTAVPMAMAWSADGAAGRCTIYHDGVAMTVAAPPLTYGAKAIGTLDYLGSQWVVFAPDGDMWRAARFMRALTALEAAAACRWAKGRW